MPEQDVVVDEKRIRFDTLNQAAFVMALEAQESPTSSRDFNRGVSYAARMLAEMRDEAYKQMGDD